MPCPVSLFFAFYVFCFMFSVERVRMWWKLIWGILCVCARARVLVWNIPGQASIWSWCIIWSTHYRSASKQCSTKTSSPLPKFHWFIFFKKLYIIYDMLPLNLNKVIYEYLIPSDHVFKLTCKHFLAF